MEGLTSEKLTGPNLNSLRGFEVIDKIKYLLEEECPITVSCADILAMVARHVVELVNTALSQGSSECSYIFIFILLYINFYHLFLKRGGPRWEVLLGRMDALELSFSGANILIPAPNSSLEVLIDNFKQQGLDIEDLVTLSGIFIILTTYIYNFLNCC